MVNTVFKIKRDMNSGRLSSLIPLSSVTDDNKEELYNKGYVLAVHSAEDIYKKFPFFKGEPIYINASPFGTDFCYYYDDTCIFSIPLFPAFNEETKEVELSMFINDKQEDAGKIYLRMKKDIQNGFFNQNNLFLLQNDGFAFDYFSLYYDHFDPEVIYDVFFSLYTHSDYGFSALSPEAVTYVLQNKTAKQKAKTKRKLKDLPDEICVYRGEGEESTKAGYSWTTDINIANFFAIRSMDNHGIIRKGKIKKSDVIEYITDNKEKEIFADPDLVYDMEEIRLYTMDEMMDEKFDFIKGVYQYFRQVLQDFPCGHDGKDHGKLHMLRTFFLGLLMYYRDGYCGELGLTDDEENAYFLSLLLHDIGRTHDREDENHGRDSFSVIMEHADFFEVPFDKKLLEYLVVCHCLGDKKAEELLYSSFGKKERKKVWTLYQLLCDADALERMRFDIRELDIKYLRTEKAIYYTQFALLNIHYLEL